MKTGMILTDTVIESDIVAVRPPLVTCTVASDVPASCGMPPNVPAEDNEIPAGSAPLTIVHV
jgi:hypothetical protein